MEIIPYYSATPYYRGWERYSPYSNRNRKAYGNYGLKPYSYHPTNNYGTNGYNTGYNTRHEYTYYPANGNSHTNQQNWRNPRYDNHNSNYSYSNNIVVPISKPTPHAHQHPELYGPIRETQIVVMGHSFVSGLENKLDKEREETYGHPTLQEQLKLKELNIQPSFMARPSIYICDLNDWNEDLSDLSPDAIVVDIGTNDICDQTEISILVEDLKTTFNHWLTTIESIQCIVLCDVLHRTKIRRKWSKKSIDVYNADVDEFNKQCLEMIHKYGPKVQPWDHRNLHHPELLGKDGVHPSTETGSWRYQRSIRGAIVRADSYTTF